MRITSRLLLILVVLHPLLLHTGCLRKCFGKCNEAYKVMQEYFEQRFARCAHGRYFTKSLSKNEYVEFRDLEVGDPSTKEDGNHSGRWFHYSRIGAKSTRTCTINVPKCPEYASHGEQIWFEMVSETDGKITLKPPSGPNGHRIPLYSAFDDYVRPTCDEIRRHPIFATQ